MVPPRTAPPVAAPADSGDDHYDVFGLKVPTVQSTGRRLRDTVQALGDAVGNLPGL